MASINAGDFAKAGINPALIKDIEEFLANVDKNHKRASTLRGADHRGPTTASTAADDESIAGIPRPERAKNSHDIGVKAGVNTAQKARASIKQDQQKQAVSQKGFREKSHGFFKDLRTSNATISEHIHSLQPEKAEVETGLEPLSSAWKGMTGMLYRMYGKKNQAKAADGADKIEDTLEKMVKMLGIELGKTNAALEPISESVQRHDAAEAANIKATPAAHESTMSPVYAALPSPKGHVAGVSLRALPRPEADVEQHFTVPGREDPIIVAGKAPIIFAADESHRDYRPKATSEEILYAKPDGSARVGINPEIIEAQALSRRIAPIVNQGARHANSAGSNPVDAFVIGPNNAGSPKSVGHMTKADLDKIEVLEPVNNNTRNGKVLNPANDIASTVGMKPDAIRAFVKRGGGLTR